MFIASFWVPSPRVSVYFSYVWYSNCSLLVMLHALHILYLIMNVDFIWLWTLIYCGFASVHWQSVCLHAFVFNAFVYSGSLQSDLVVLHARLQLGKCAFALDAPSVWNSFPNDVRTLDKIFIFKSCLPIPNFLQLTDNTHLQSHTSISDLVFSISPHLQFTFFTFISWHNISPFSPYCCTVTAMLCICSL